ncbi:unnamed protein product, partial [Pocillopora meandrina]
MGNLSWIVETERLRIRANCYVAFSPQLSHHCRPRVKLGACCTTIHSYLCRPIVLITADLMEEVYVFFVFFYCMYLSRIRFLAETDRLVMTLFVVVTTNSVSSRAILPVMVLASTPKTGMVILRG